MNNSLCSGKIRGSIFFPSDKNTYSGKENTTDLIGGVGFGAEYFFNPILVPEWRHSLILLKQVKVHFVLAILMRLRLILLPQPPSMFSFKKEKIFSKRKGCLFRNNLFFVVSALVFLVNPAFHFFECRIFHLFQLHLFPGATNIIKQFGRGAML